MKDRSLIGMWKYAVTKKLRKRINKAATKIMCLKIDQLSELDLVDTFCGTKGLKEDCPFYVRASESDQEGFCLAPSHDKFWHEAMKREKQFISPTYEKKQYMVVGCYISIFCELGLATYNRLRLWRRKYERIRSLEMAIQRYYQT